MAYFNPIKVTKQSAPEVIEVALRAFPEYKGRKIRVAPFNGPMHLTSGWDGGSKDWYFVVPLVAGHGKEVLFTVPDNGTFPTQNNGARCMLSDLPEGMALVKHSVCCGVDVGLTVYVNAANFNANLVTEGRAA